MSTLIASLDRGSPAERAGVNPGEKLISINGHPIVDVLDYRFFGYDGELEVELELADGTRRILSVSKEDSLANICYFLNYFAALIASLCPK